MEHLQNVYLKASDGDSEAQFECYGTSKSIFLLKNFFPTNSTVKTIALSCCNPLGRILYGKFNSRKTKAQLQRT